MRALAAPSHISESWLRRWKLRAAWLFIMNMGPALLPINTSFIFSASSAIQFANGDADGTISGFDWVHMPLPGRKQARRAPTPSIFLAGIRKCLALQRPLQTACASASPPAFHPDLAAAAFRCVTPGCFPVRAGGRLGARFFSPAFFFGMEERAHAGGTAAAGAGEARAVPLTVQSMWLVLVRALLASCLSTSGPRFHHAWLFFFFFFFFPF